MGLSRTVSQTKGDNYKIFTSPCTKRPHSEGYRWNLVTALGLTKLELMPNRRSKRCDDIYAFVWTCGIGRTEGRTDGPKQYFILHALYVMRVKYTVT